MEVECFYKCGTPVDLDDPWSVMQGLWGWTPLKSVRPTGKRVEAGADVVYRQLANRYAHSECVRKEQRGLSAGQGALV